MNPLANRPFLKMNGIGNEIIVLDLRGTPLQVSATDARAIGAAQFSGNSLHYDQMMVIHDPVTSGTAARMKIFNIDGSLSGACGNGTRCVAWTMMEGSDAHRLILESDAGLLECTREGPWRFTVDMGEPRLGWSEIPLSVETPDTTGVVLPGAQQLGPFGAVSMGNPHAVFFVDDVEAHQLETIGPLIEHHAMFPQRVNVSLAHVVSREEIDLKVWERGTGLTLACGSAACATLVAASRRQLTGDRATINLPGGELVIEWHKSTNHVFMTGDVELEFEGRFDPAIFETANA